MQTISFQQVKVSIIKNMPIFSKWLCVYVVHVYIFHDTVVICMHDLILSDYKINCGHNTHWLKIQVLPDEWV